MADSETAGSTHIHVQPQSHPQPQPQPYYPATPLTEKAPSTHGVNGDANSSQLMTRHDEDDAAPAPAPASVVITAPTGSVGSALASFGISYPIDATQSPSVASNAPMNPAASGSQQPPAGQKQAPASPSGSEHDRKEAKEREVLADLIAHVSPATCRAVVGNYPSKCLTGTEDHTVMVMREALNGFQTPEMSVEAKRALISLFSRKDLDFVGDILIAKASNRLLDSFTDLRIQTMDGQRLLNMLAVHERIGFRKSDLNLDNIGQDGRDDTYQAVATSPSTFPRTYICVWCDGVCADATALKFHLLKAICTAKHYHPARYTVRCSRCLHPFGNAKALAFHQNNRVCSLPQRPPMPPTARPILDSPSSSTTTQSPGLTPVAHFQTTFAASPHPCPHQHRQQQQQHTPRQPAPQKPHTPTSSQSPRNQIRLNDLNDPDDPDGTLLPADLAKMKQELDEARNHYADQIAEAESSSVMTPDEAKKRVNGFKNSLNTKQSMVRKKYGIRLRGPRTPSHLMAERVKLSEAITKAEQHRGPIHKRMRTGPDGAALPTQVGPHPDLVRKPATPVMVGNGLLPATNVPRTALDPTASQSPVFSSSMPTVPSSYAPSQPASQSPLSPMAPFKTILRPVSTARAPQDGPGTPSAVTATASWGSSNTPITLDSSSPDSSSAADIDVYPTVEAD